MREKEVHYDENVIDKQFETRNDAMHAECVCLFVRLKCKQMFVVLISITLPIPRVKRFLNPRQTYVTYGGITCRLMEFGVENGFFG